MSRFTEPNKWKDAWFRKLQPPEKLVWLYLVDTCDNAGFFDYDPEMIAFFTGMEQKNVEKAFKGLARGLVGAKDGAEYHIKNFLKHQRNLPLNEINNAHRQIIRIITEKKESFPDLLSSYLGPNEGLISPIGIVKVKVDGKGRGKVAEYTEDFLEWWKSYSIGSKRNAFDAWRGQKVAHDMVSTLVGASLAYKAYCLSVERPFKDGQGWINGRFWETEWTHEAQGTTPIAKEVEHYD